MNKCKVCNKEFHYHWLTYCLVCANKIIKFIDDGSAGTALIKSAVEATEKAIERMEKAFEEYKKAMMEHYPIIQR